MDRNKLLEELSDRVRQGIPISMAEAIRVIQYQDERRKWRASLPWYKRLCVSTW